MTLTRPAARRAELAAMPSDDLQTLLMMTREPLTEQGRPSPDALPTIGAACEAAAIRGTLMRRGVTPDPMTPERFDAIAEAAERMTRAARAAR